MNQSGAGDIALDTALTEYLGWFGDPVATLTAAVEADPGFILGHTTIAALNSLGGVNGDAPQVKAALAAADNLAGGATPREKLHLAGAKAWAAGDITGAAASWEAALETDPRDLLALRLAHDTHFFLGASAKLRDVPLSVLPAYDHAPAQRGFVLGMAAFGLEETGDYAEAESLGREAVGLNPADSWAIHAVAHVLEMQDRPDEGATWLRELEPHWVPAAGLAVHQWWHAALFLIELGRLDEVLALYDTQIRGNQSALILDLVDAAALLWRLELLGLDVGARWQELAAVWAQYAEDHVLVFNDLHIAMSFAGAGDNAAADLLEASVARYAAAEHGTNATVSRQLGLPAIQALLAFRTGDYARTVALLAPIYQNLAPIGGSNAQRDLLIQTLGIAALKAGDIALARAVAADRKRLKSGRPRAWSAYQVLH
jgi:tetratricopeptide (TPR) repeat protein